MDEASRFPAAFRSLSRKVAELPIEAGDVLVLDQQSNRVAYSGSAI